VSDDVERELKLVPDDPGLLDRLAAQNQFGELLVAGRRTRCSATASSIPRARTGHEASGLSPPHGRGPADGHLVAEVGRQSPARRDHRSEIEVQLDADMAPMLALSTLRQVASQRGAAALAERSRCAERRRSALAQPFVH